MKKVFYTPGPSELYFTYSDHLRQALKDQVGSISHRSAAFEKIFQHTTEQLKELFELPEGYHVVFAYSATEIWERIAQNLIKDTSEHFVHGAFGRKFHGVAQAWDKDAKLSEIGDEFISTKSSASLIGLTLNETSTGFSLTKENLAEMRSLNPDSLISLDVVSAAPAVPVDFQMIDTAFLSVQKCFGMPAGLGVWVVNDRSVDMSRSIGIKSYHSLPSLIDNARKFQTPSTPNALSIYLLGKIAEDMNRRGIKAIHSEINYKAALLYQSLEAHPSFKLSVPTKKHRSKTTIVTDCLNGNDEILRFFEEKGVVIGTGYGDQKKDKIRIANFPTHSKEQVEMLCDSLENFG